MSQHDFLPWFKLNGQNYQCQNRGIASYDSKSNALKFSAIRYANRRIKERRQILCLSYKKPSQIFVSPLSHKREHALLIFYILPFRGRGLDERRKLPNLQAIKNLLILTQL